MSLPSEGGDLVTSRCKIPILEAVVSLYFHIGYPPDVFDDEELQALHQDKATAVVRVAAQEVGRAEAPALRQASAAREL